MGRPKLPPGTAHTVFFAFKIAANEAEQVERAAQRAGLTKSEWARQKVIAAAKRGE